MIALCTFEIDHLSGGEILFFFSLSKQDTFIIPARFEQD